MLRFSENNLQFGTIESGVMYPFSVIVFNDGEEEIRPSLSASCGCTTPNLEPRSIPAKGQASLDGIFDTTGKKGHQHKRVYLTYTSNSDKPITRSITLDFYAEIIEPEN